MGEIGLAGLGLSRVGHEGFATRGEFTVMKMIGAGTHIPQALGEEVPISQEECLGPRRLVLMYRLGIGIARYAADVVQLEVRICGHMNHAVDRHQTWAR